MSSEFDIFVDAKGLKCPQPLLLTKQAMQQLCDNQILLLQATDAHTDLDIEVWCARFQHKILKTAQKDGVLNFWIKK